MRLVPACRHDFASSLAASCIALTATLPHAAAAAGQRFFVTPLRASDGTLTRVVAEGINDYGQVVGWSEPLSFGSTSAVPHLWSPSTPNALAVSATALPGTTTTSMRRQLRLNHVGQVAFSATGSIWTPNLPNGTSGTALPADAGPAFASTWPQTPGPLQDVNGMPIGGTILWRNDAGQTLIRFDYDFDGLWEPIGGVDSQRGTVQRLGLLPMADGGTIFFARNNERGMITGTHAYPGANPRAMLFERVDGVWTRRPIGPEVGPERGTSAVDITDSGLVAGTSVVPNPVGPTPPLEPFVWDPRDGSTTILKDALESTSGRGWQITAPVGMNERGQFVVNGRLDHDNNPATAAITSAALLTPGQPGDANFDFVIGFSDLVTLAQSYNEQTGQTWLTGDFTGDGAVGFADLVVLAQNYNRPQATFAADWALAQSLVPEPVGASASVLIMTAARRRRMPR